MLEHFFQIKKEKRKKEIPQNTLTNKAHTSRIVKNL
jgi:hypothetical protein